VIDVSLQPRRHDPPAGWDRAVFDRVTAAIAAAMVAAVRRGQAEHAEAEADAG
jgi:hypothetical protein